MESKLLVEAGLLGDLCALAYDAGWRFELPCRKRAKKLGLLPYSSCFFSLGSHEVLDSTMESTRKEAFDRPVKTILTLQSLLKHETDFECSEANLLEQICTIA